MYLATDRRYTDLGWNTMSGPAPILRLVYQHTGTRAACDRRPPLKYLAICICTGVLYRLVQRLSAERPHQIPPAMRSAWRSQPVRVSHGKLYMSQRCPYNILSRSRPALNTPPPPVVRDALPNSETNPCFSLFTRPSQNGKQNAAVVSVPPARKEQREKKKPPTPALPPPNRDSPQAYPEQEEDELPNPAGPAPIHPRPFNF
ncbi:uncharacterized protein B0H64DRAFT_239890 [Chaetomium fimeti]|uniref:Uncharacterized protein n=1 Tax=Chaetomium fimeti TaxID=1854472 RepID=A0AAE0HA30_9PEZI|nr:hypothetical protein B0H64DRAFT_239890 [Chaetomium fimeti]